MPTLVTDSLPDEGAEVVIYGTFTGARRGYQENGQWWEAVDEDDVPILGVLSWEPIPAPPSR